MALGLSASLAGGVGCGRIRRSQANAASSQVSNVALELTRFKAAATKEKQELEQALLAAQVRALSPCLSHVPEEEEAGAELDIPWLQDSMNGC